ncbi:MAG TPA: DnaD domain-containing protein [Bacillaceae bacterium]|nr:DnaD domain-containing protein [Paenibacillus bovis]HLU23728.1 DnaD domain-containing protein [Bacillaceae bacterium]
MDNKMIVAWMESGMMQIPILLMEKYRQIGLDEKELIVLLQVISFIEKGNHFPTPEELSERMTITSKECSLILRRLIQLQLLKIEKDNSEEVRSEKYSVAPLWTKLADELMSEQKQKDLQTVLDEGQDIYTMFEQEFGRPLSPMECESLAMWLDEDKQDPVIIKAALRESVLSGKVNFRYIDRILFEWKKNGIRTLEQVKIHSAKFRQKPKTTAEQQLNNKKSGTVPLYNWLEQ